MLLSLMKRELDIIPTPQSCHSEYNEQPAFLEQQIPRGCALWNERLAPNCYLLRCSGDRSALEFSARPLLRHSNLQDNVIQNRRALGRPCDAHHALRPWL